MRNTLAPSSNSNRKLVYFLAAIPLFDCILNQINNAFNVTFAGLSLLQVVRGYMVLVLLAICLFTLIKDESRISSIPLPAVGALILIAMASTKELIATGALAMPSIGAYGQMAYWVMLWITASIVCRDRSDFNIILRGLAIGALATAASVLIGFAAGGLNPYADDGVDASAGWFHTAKTITGVLDTGVVVLLYLGRSSRNWWAPILAVICCAACLFTYARAGLVALVVAVTWMFVWWIFLGRGHRQWLTHFLILCCAFSFLLPVFLNSSSFSARWQDIHDPDKGGSGRETFWRVAIHGYENGTAMQQTLGRGYSSMSDMLFTNYGADIKHTHNDMLDMLLVGGMAGAAWLIFMIGTFLVNTFRSSLSTPEGAAGFAVLLIYLLHAQFTGQLWGTDSMTYYVLAMTCLYRMRATNTVPAALAHAQRNLAVSRAAGPAFASWGGEDYVI